MKEKTHVVCFDQGNKECPFRIDTVSKHREMRELLPKLDYQWVYTDLFIGSEEECEKFMLNHKLYR